MSSTNPSSTFTNMSIFIKRSGDAEAVFAPLEILPSDAVANLADRASLKFRWNISADKIKLYLVPVELSDDVADGKAGCEALVLSNPPLSSIKNLSAVGISNGSCLLARVTEVSTPMAVSPNEYMTPASVFSSSSSSQSSSFVFQPSKKSRKIQDKSITARRVCGSSTSASLKSICVTRGPDSPSRARALFQADKSCIKKRDFYGRGALYFALASDEHDVNDVPVNVDLVRALVEMDPDALQETDTENSLPIHIACQNKFIPLEVVKILHEAFANSVKQQDRHHRLPLHLACESNCNISVIKFLCMVFSDAVKEREMFGCYPLICACRSEAPVSTIKLLLGLFPAAAKGCNRHGFLPIHWACKNNAPVEIIQILLLAFPEGVKEGNNYHVTPLHLLCKAPQPSFETIEMIMKAFPDARRKMDGRGYQPEDYLAKGSHVRALFK